MRVVVTGATGHLGRSLVHRLATQGHEVVACSRGGRVPALPFEAAEHGGLVRPLALDLSSDAAVDTLAKELGPNVALVHLAAWVPPATAASTIEDRSVLIEVNVVGTLRVLDAARRAGGVRSVVYASSFEVYGVPSSEGPVTEGSPARPFSDYGATKLSGEDHLFAFAEEERAVVVSLRMPALYGPGESVSRALPNFLEMVRRGERPQIQGDGSDLRDELHVRDAALSVECALLARRTGTYNVSDGEAHSIAELARTALEAAGLGGAPEFVPATKARFDFHMSIDKIRRELGFQPRVTLLEGMREQLRWLGSGTGSLRT